MTPRFHWAFDWRWPTVSYVATFIGFGLIGVGAVLPWASKDLPVQVYVLGMQTGLERIWVRRLLVVAGIGLLLAGARLVTTVWRSALTFVIVGIGGIIAVITVLTSPLTGPWQPARGVYITLVGSLLVSLGSSLTLITMHFTSDTGSHRSVRE